MKKEKIFLNYKGKEFEIEAKTCGFWERFSGLMLKKKENTSALLFKFKNPPKTKLHSLFVFFPFYMITLDKKNKVIELKKISPFTPSISPKKQYSKILEIPENKKYSNIIKKLMD